jgi:hypothetical protein
MEKEPKDIGVMIALTPDLKSWVDSQAAEMGLNGPYAASIWIAMMVFQARKRQNSRQPQAHHAPPLPTPPAAFEPQQLPVPEEDLWRGPVEDDEPPPADIDELVSKRLAEAESQGLTQPTNSADTHAVASVPGVAGAGTNVRPLRRPAPRFSPAMQPGWLG